MIVPKVIDMTGPINGDTNIAATIFDALFSTRPSAASELKKNYVEKKFNFNNLYETLTQQSQSAANNQKSNFLHLELHPQLASPSVLT